MSDVIGFEASAKANEHKVCRVAYTLNNDQPVISTIIGEQPLFYMDYDAEIEEEELLDAAELNILEQELERLNKDLAAMERFSAEYGKDVGAVSDEFKNNKQDVLNAQTAAFESIEALKAVISKSRLGAAYLELAEQHNVALKHSSQIDGAAYDRKAGIIFVNANLDEADQILVCARELRRHWQHRQGALIHPLMFHPDNAILVNRVQTADLAASLVRISWELQLSDYKAAWERIENSSMADLGRAFAREAFADFRTINNGQASTAVFEAWFLSERCRTEDRTIIQSMLADYQGYVFDQEEAEQAITPALISAVGAMPFGKNYLSEHVHTIMNDAIFTDVRDRSNANFLWFIKFEKTFREVEQELQLESSNQTADDIRQAAYLKEQGEHNATGTQTTIGSDAQIIRLFGEEQFEENRNVESSRASNGGKGAEIIFLR